MQKLSTRYKRSCVRLLDPSEKIKGQRRKMSDPDIQHVSEISQRSQPISIPAAATSPIISPHVEGQIVFDFTDLK